MKPVITLVLLASLAGCATQKIATDGISQINQTVRDLPEVATADEGHPQQIFAGEIYRISQSDTLLARTVSVNYPMPVGLNTLADYLARHHGITMRVDGDLDTLPVDPYAQAAGLDPKPGQLLLDHNGNLRALLDSVAARLQLWWKIDGNQVTFYQVTTRSWPLALFDGLTKLDVSVKNNSGSGGGAGGGSEALSSQDTRMTIQDELLKSVQQSVSSMLSARGKMSIAGGTLTVSDQPPVLDRIDEYLTGLNDRLTRQVVVDVQVYSVETNTEQNLGVNWNLVWESLNGRYGANTQIITPDVVGASSMNLAVIDPTWNYGGTQLLIQALEQQGNVSRETALSVATLSNQPTPVLIARETGYLKSMKTQLVANTGAETTIQGDTKTTGFAMTLYPIVLDDDQLLLQYHLDLSSLRSIREIDVSTSRIELPQVDVREFIQRVKLRSGQSVVMAGFSQKLFRHDTQGTASKALWFAGGARTAGYDRSELVLVLTPRIL